MMKLVHELAIMSKGEIIFAEYETLCNKCTQLIRNKKKTKNIFNIPHCQ